MENTPNNQPQHPRRREEGGEMMKWIERTVLISLIFGFFLIDEKGRVTLLAWVGGTAYILTMIFVYFRLKNQEVQTDIQTKQFQAQAEKEVNDRFHSAVALLGNSQTSARTGAIYSLYHLAVESEKYRSQIAEILCAHIRSTTREEKYRKEYAGQPSEEIQTALNLLFRNDRGARGLYCQFFDQLPVANLSLTYLVNALFSGATLQGVWFINAVCQGAIFAEAKCQRAIFAQAHCQGALFVRAQCQGATFAAANCNAANFSEASCQDADFSNASFLGAFALSSHKIPLFYTRLGESTEIDTMYVFGDVGEKFTGVLNILDYVNFHDTHMEFSEKVKQKAGESISFGCPVGIISGVLDKDDPEMLKLFQKYESSHVWRRPPPV